MKSYGRIKVVRLMLEGGHGKVSGLSLSLVMVRVHEQLAMSVSEHIDR